MGCASKLLTLLTSPLSKLHAFPSSLRLIRHPCISISSFPKPRLYSSSITRSLLPFSINPTSQLIHTPADNRFTSEDFHIDNSASSSSRVSHRWPEWSKLVDNLRASGYFDLQVGLDGEDALSVYLPEEFLQPVAVCLAFARRRADLLGSLSRKDIEAVVTNGSPFLFKSSLDSARRMKLFLDNTSVNEPEFERAQTVDLMRFLLSHVYGPFVVSEGPNLRNGQPVESSVRNLLTEMADASRAVQEFGHSSSKQFSDGYGQATRPLRQNIEMKRGDWICPRCSFMNFARNMKCLECSEARPKRQLSDGEWECPRCDFFNYSRNVVCKKCDCKRPGETSFGSVETRSTLGYNNESTRTAPLEQRLPDTQFQRNWGNDDALQGNNFRSVGGASPGTSTTGMPTSQSMDGMSGYSSCPSEVKYNATATWQNTTGSEWGSVPSSSPHYTQQSDYVSVVPSPDGMFAKSQNSRQETTVTWQNTTGSEWGSVPSSSSQQFRSFEGKQSDYVPFVPSPVNQTQNVAQQYENTQNARESWKGGFTGKSLEGSLVKEPDPLDMSEEAKAERWFRRASQIKDISELSQIPDEDFPQIMPMRKGVNRFVVSKRKTPLERRLTSPQYRRNLPIVSSEPLKKDDNES